MSEMFKITPETPAPEWRDYAQEEPCGWVTTFQVASINDYVGFPVGTAEMLTRIREEHRDHPPGSCKR